MEMPRLKVPDTVLIICSIIVLAAVATWLIPPGAFEKEVMMVEGAGEREVVIPGSFSYLERPEAGFISRFGSTIGAILLAPIRGISDPGAIPIIAFVLLVGGAFAVLQRTGAIDAALKRLAQMAANNRHLRIVLIPLFMVLFSLGGATFGMAEEIIPFVLIFVPLALALGYDSITGFAIPFVGSQIGFAAAFLNPFTVGVAQGISEVPLFSGIGFRIVMWFVLTTIGITVVVLHARKVQRKPELSPTYQLDEELRASAIRAEEAPPLNRRHTLVLLTFLAGMVMLVWGVLNQGWYIFEIAALFVGMGIVMGVVGGLNATQISVAFQEGAKDLVVTALIIGLARGILIVLQDGQVIDTILYSLSSVVDEAGPVVSSYLMFVTQFLINMAVPSGSGQAALTMPLMAPLADLVGVTRQTAVLAFQLGDGLGNTLIPTSAVLMGALSLARIPWVTWAKWILPLQGIQIVVGLIALTIAVLIGYS